jgi:hypothetical protein
MFKERGNVPDSGVGLPGVVDWVKERIRFQVLMFARGQVVEK